MLFYLPSPGVVNEACSWSKFFKQVVSRLCKTFGMKKCVRSLRFYLQKLYHSEIPKSIATNSSDL